LFSPSDCADLEISQKLTEQLGVKVFMFGAVFYTCIFFFHLGIGREKEKMPIPILEKTSSFSQYIVASKTGFFFNIVRLKVK